MPDPLELLPGEAVGPFHLGAPPLSPPLPLLSASSPAQLTRTPRRDRQPPLQRAQPRPLVPLRLPLGSHRLGRRREPRCPSSVMWGRRRDARPAAYHSEPGVAELTNSSDRPQSPSSSPIHLSLTSPPLHLTFSPLSQRLSRIEVQGLDPASTVSYRGKCLGAPGEEDDVVKTLRRALGPTYGSSTVTSAQNGAGGAAEEMLSYPGVAFGVTRAQGGPSLASLLSSRALAHASCMSRFHPQAHHRHAAASPGQRLGRASLAARPTARVTRHRAWRPPSGRNPRTSALR